MQGFEKGHQRRGLRRAQILAISRHVAASLDHLANELVLREPHRNTVQRRTPLPTLVCQGMAIAALLDLKYKRSLPLQRGCPFQESHRHRCTAPGVHLWAPG